MKTTSRNYQDLIVWKKAINLVEIVYAMTRSFPKEELFALTSQIRRSVVSIPSNIAEGEGRGTPKEFTHFLRIAYGSLREVETQTIIAAKLGYIDHGKTEEILDSTGEVGRLINGLIRSLA